MGKRSKKTTGFGEVLAKLPDLMTKAIDYFDGRAESKIPTQTTRHIDKVYLENFEKSLPDLMKGKNNQQIIQRKSYDTDLQTGAADYGFKDRTSAISFDTLYRMAMRDAIVSSIIVTRTNQISNFSRPQRDRYSMGFSFSLKNHDREMTEDDVKKCAALEEWLLNCGSKEDREPKERITFEEFIRRIIPDRLTYDAVAIEAIPCEDGSLHHFIPVSSATIRFANKRFHEIKGMMVAPEWFGVDHVERDPSLEPEAEDYRYLQVYRGMVIEGFSDDELIYRQGNPTNEPGANGYSIPELERLVSVVASHVYAETHNKQFFTGGFTAQGILHFKGDIPQEQMDGFRRAWETQTTGATNSFRTPIIATEEEVTWLPISVNNKDMEWKEWMNYLIKIICGVYQIDPSEIGFWDLSQGAGGSLNEGNRNEQILKQSRDKGLRPMLRFVESIVNEQILPRLDPDVASEFEFRFVGLESEERREEVDRHAIEVKTKKTVNQVRRESGLPPLPNMDNMILDPIYFQWWQGFSPEAIDLKIKNMALEKVLLKKYNIQLDSVIEEDDINQQEIMEEQGQGENQSSSLYRSKKNKNSLIKVEYLRQ